MPVIKRYPNRKLYDTQAKQYITLEGIAQLVRQGEEIQVIDHATGEDLTALTLSQIIFEQEKKRSGFLPQSVLTGLIRSGGHTLSVLRRTLASPLGLLYQIDEEIEARLRALVEKGELTEQQGKNLRDKLLAQGGRANNRPRLNQQRLERLLSERDIPTRQDLDQVIQELEALAAKLDAID